MASADVRDELLCSICLTTYTDPITLRCGHNFCRVCIDRVLDTQDESGVYSCPECREQFWQRPALRRNIALHNVAERLRSTQQPQEEITGICCTYCIHSPVPAVKSCLMCEASLCDNHLQVHSKGAEHVLTEPSTNLENRKCPVHKKILEYYCTEDAACICVSCRLDGDHRGHWVEMLDEASEKKKKKLRNVLQKLITKRKETEERVQSLEERRRKAQEKASGEAERVTALFIDTRRRLEDMGKRFRSEISRQEKEVSLPSSTLRQQLEIQKEVLSRTMRHIEELCNMTDPLTVLQDLGDLCDPEEEGGYEDTKGHDGGDEDTKGIDGGDDDTKGYDGGDEDTGRHDKTQDVDVVVIKGMLQAGFSDIIKYLQNISPTTSVKKRKLHQIYQSPPFHAQDSPVSGAEYKDDNVIVKNENVGGKVTAAGEGGIYGQGPADILLDINTAANNLLISDDLKTATWTNADQDCPEEAERFQYDQVISRGSFSSGRHYWDVQMINSGLWRVGVCYPSMDRRGEDSYLGDNNKSWSLWGGLWCNDDYSVRHDSNKISLPQTISSARFRICLDYEAGLLCFYELCDPIRHLCTIATTFTEPLHAALFVYDGSVKILGGAVAGTSGST